MEEKALRPHRYMRWLGLFILAASVILLSSCCEVRCPWCIHPSKRAEPTTGLQPGDVVHYYISYENPESNALTMVIVDDYNQTYGSVSNISGSTHFPPGTDNGDTITWGPEPVPAGTSGWLAYDYTLAGSGAFNFGTTLITNTASINGVSVSATIEVVVAPLPPLEGEGRLVVLADDWPLGNYFYGCIPPPQSDSEIFLFNCLYWLNEGVINAVGSSNKHILLDKGYEEHSGGAGSLKPLETKLENSSYTYKPDDDKIPADQWDTALLADYDLAILERGPDGHPNWNYQDVATWVKAGHGLLVIGGITASEEHNSLLQQFNVQFQPHDGGMGINEITNFVAHAVTQGISSLCTMNPTPITVLGYGPEILCQQDPKNTIWLVVLDLASL